MERRRAARARCAIPCDFRAEQKTVEAMVRNVSEGGLGVEAPLTEAAAGDSLELTLKPSGRAPITLVAIVWHSRTVRRSAASEPVGQLGLVLSEAEEDYFDLVASLVPRSRARPEQQPSSPPPSAPLLSFSVQVAQAGSPRTRQILVRARDVEGARQRAVEETGPGWSVVAVSPARSA